MLHQREILLLEKQNNLDSNNFSWFFTKWHSVPPQTRNAALPVYGEEDNNCKPEEDTEKTAGPSWHKWAHLHG